MYQTRGYLEFCTLASHSLPCAQPSNVLLPLFFAAGKRTLNGKRDVNEVVQRASLKKEQREQLGGNLDVVFGNHRVP